MNAAVFDWALARGLVLQLAVVQELARRYFAGLRELSTSITSDPETGNEYIEIRADLQSTPERAAADYTRVIEAWCDLLPAKAGEPRLVFYLADKQ